MSKRLLTNYPNFDWNDFAAKAEKLIKYVSGSTQSPINADRWEEIIFHTLKVMGQGYQNGPPKWVSGSHAPGADIWVDQFAISAKAGQITGDYLVISSYRLTRFENLAAMQEFMDGPGKNFDFYLCCARLDSRSQRTYKVYVVPADVFIATNLSWAEAVDSRGQSSGWSGSDSSGVIVDIRKKMSNQLWLKVPLEYCELATEVNIPTDELGLSLEKVLLSGGQA